ncbi:MAG: hypothetical protein O3B27_05595, partial [Actinomycetota bacterium]|nr:hypothetical protein [Actinomycetota bacterium]
RRCGNPPRRTTSWWIPTSIGTVESWTTPYDRDGNPEKAFLAVRTPDGSRTLALIDDPDQAAQTVTEDIAGAAVRVRPDGRASLQT